MSLQLPAQCKARHNAHSLMSLSPPRTNIRRCTSWQQEARYLLNPFHSLCTSVGMNGSCNTLHVPHTVTSDVPLWQTTPSCVIVSTATSCAVHVPFQEADDVSALSVNTCASTRVPEQLAIESDRDVHCSLAAYHDPRDTPTRVSCSLLPLGLFHAVRSSPLS